MSLRNIIAGRIAIENPYTVATVSQQGADSISIDYAAPNEMTITVLFKGGINVHNVVNCSVYEYGTSLEKSNAMSEDENGLYISFEVTPGENYLVFFEVVQIPALLNPSTLAINQVLSWATHCLFLHKVN